MSPRQPRDPNAAPDASPANAAKAAAQPRRGAAIPGKAPGGPPRAASAEAAALSRDSVPDQGPDSAVPDGRAPKQETEQIAHSKAAPEAVPTLGAQAGFEAAPPETGLPTPDLPGPDADNRPVKDTGMQTEPDAGTGTGTGTGTKDASPGENSNSVPSHRTAIEAAGPTMRPGGAGALILGGAVAAALGFGVALLAFPDGTGANRAVQATEARLARVEAALAEGPGAASPPAGPDLSVVMPEITALVDSRATLTDDRLSERIAALQREILDPRATELRENAQAVGELAARVATITAALATLTADVEGLRAAAGTGPMAPGAADAPDPETLAQMLAPLADAIDTAQAETRKVAAERAALIAERTAWSEEREALSRERQGLAERLAADLSAAQTAARQARIGAALLDLEGALASGEPFEGALNSLVAEGLRPESGLADPAARGVPTQADLQASFAEAARAALRASLAVDPEGGLADRALTFLRIQTGARALAPRAGDDPDAILSRAEAALAKADLAAALAELDSLPATAAARIAPWRALAETRRAALDAFAALPAAPGR